MAEPTLKNSVTVGLGRLPDQFEEQPNITGVLDAFLQETQAVEDLAFEVNTTFDKDTAIGVQLDIIGKIVGESREGKSDEPYRDAINSAIDANTATGTINNITNVIQRSLPDSVDYFSAVNEMPDPYNPVGWYGQTTDPNGTIINQGLLNPSGQSFIGLAEQTGTGLFRVASTQAVPVTSIESDVYYLDIVCKNVTASSYLSLTFQSNELSDRFAVVNINDFTVTLDSGDVTVSGQDLDDGFSLIQMSFKTPQDLTGVVGRINLLDESGTITAAEVGTQIQVQAVFFGRTGRSLGSIEYAGTNQMSSAFFPTSWNFDAVNLSIAKTLMDNPSGEPFTGLVEQTGASTGDIIVGSTFQASASTIVSMAILARSVTNDNFLKFTFGDSGGLLADVVIDASDGTISAGGGSLTVTSDNLSNGFFLYQIQFSVTSDDLAFTTQVELTDSSGTGSPSIGSKVYVQAAFSGITSALPATISLPDTNLFPATVTLAEDKSVVVFEHFPADIHVIVVSPESQAISDSLDVIRSAGVKGTMAFLPESSLALIPQEISILRRFLITNTGDQIVTNDGGGGLSELVVETIIASETDESGGFLAEIIPEDGERLNVALETLRVD